MHSLELTSDVNLATQRKVTALVEVTFSPRVVVAADTIPTAATPARRWVSLPPTSSVTALVRVVACLQLSSLRVVTFSTPTPPSLPEARQGTDISSGGVPAPPSVGSVDVERLFAPIEVIPLNDVPRVLDQHNATRMFVSENRLSLALVLKGL